MQMMIQDTLVYRANFIFRYVNWIIRFFVLAYLWTSIFAAKEGDIAGFSLSDTLTYFLILQVITSLTFSRAGFMISNQIQSGELSSKLILPVNYIYLQIARDFGQNFFFFISHIVIYGGIALIFKDSLTLDFNWLFVLLSLPVMFFSYLIAFSMIALIGMLAFWLSTAKRLIFVYFAIHTLLSGFLIPIAFFPQGLQNILKWTPFPYNYSYIAELIQSKTWTESLSFGLTMTFVYSIGLMILLHFVFYLGLRKYEAVGQ